MNITGLPSVWRIPARNADGGSTARELEVTFGNLFGDEVVVLYPDPDKPGIIVRIDALMDAHNDWRTNGH
jgi:hypothetical protein